jgi:hypothetical protein
MCVPTFTRMTFCTVRRRSLLDSYWPNWSIFRISFEVGFSALLSFKFLTENLTLSQLVDILSPCPPLDRSHTFIISFITVYSWTKLRCCSPSSLRSRQVMSFFVVFRLKSFMHILSSSCVLQSLSSYFSWCNNQKHCFDTSCTIAYFHQVQLPLLSLACMLVCDLPVSERRADKRKYEFCMKLCL